MSSIFDMGRNLYNFTPLTFPDFRREMDGAFKELDRKLKDADKLPAAQARIAELEGQVKCVLAARDNNYNRAERETERAGKLANELVNLNARIAELKETLGKTEKALAAEAGKRATAEVEVGKLKKERDEKFHVSLFEGPERLLATIVPHGGQTEYVRWDVHSKLKKELAAMDRELDRVAQQHGMVCDALNKSGDRERKLTAELAEAKRAHPPGFSTFRPKRVRVRCGEAFDLFGAPIEYTFTEPRELEVSF